MMLGFSLFGLARADSRRSLQGGQEKNGQSQGPSETGKNGAQSRLFVSVEHKGCSDVDWYPQGSPQSPEYRAAMERAEQANHFGPVRDHSALLLFKKDESFAQEIKSTEEDLLAVALREEDPSYFSLWYAPGTVYGERLQMVPKQTQVFLQKPTSQKLKSIPEEQIDPSKK